MNTTTATTGCHYCGAADARLNVPGRDGGRWHLCTAHVIDYRKGA